MHREGLRVQPPPYMAATQQIQDINLTSDDMCTTVPAGTLGPKLILCVKRVNDTTEDNTAPSCSFRYP